MKRSVESSVGVTPCRWKHFLLDNHLREKGTAGFYLIGTILTLAKQRQGNGGDDSLQASVNGETHLILKHQLRESCRGLDSILEWRLRAT